MHDPDKRIHINTILRQLIGSTTIFLQFFLLVQDMYKHDFTYTQKLRRMAMLPTPILCFPISHISCIYMQKEHIQEHAGKIKLRYGANILVIFIIIIIAPVQSASRIAAKLVQIATDR
jgi:hypothetical protein